MSVLPRFLSFPGPLHSTFSFLYPLNTNLDCIWTSLMSDLWNVAKKRAACFIVNGNVKKSRLFGSRERIGSVVFHFNPSLFSILTPNSPCKESWGDTSPTCPQQWNRKTHENIRQTLNVKCFTTQTQWHIRFCSRSTEKCIIWRPRGFEFQLDCFITLEPDILVLSWAVWAQRLWGSLRITSCWGRIWHAASRWFKRKKNLPVDLDQGSLFKSRDMCGCKRVSC